MSNSIRRPVITEDHVPEGKTEGIILQKKSRKKSRKNSYVGNMISFFFGGKFLEDRNNIHLLKYLIFLTVLFVGYINYGFWCERLIRKVNHLQKELNEQRAEYIFMTGECMFVKKQSQLAEKAKKAGIYMSTTPPRVLLADSTYLEK